MIEKPDSIPEKRSTSRRRVLKGAKIIFNNGNSTISCQIRDQSENGARLKVDSILGIPESFALKIMAEDPRLAKWRGEPIAN